MLSRHILLRPLWKLLYFLSHKYKFPLLNITFTIVSEQYLLLHIHFQHEETLCSCCIIAYIFFVYLDNKSKCPLSYPELGQLIKLCSLVLEYLQSTLHKLLSKLLRPKLINLINFFRKDRNVVHQNFSTIDKSQIYSQ